MTLLLKGGRMIDPSRKMDSKADLLIENGKIVAMRQGAPAKRNALPERRSSISAASSSSPA